MIIIHYAELGNIETMKKEKIKTLCKVCDHKIYKDGEVIDISSGGIMLRGGLKPEGMQHNHNDEEADLVAELDAKAPDMKMTKMDSALSESKKFKNLSHFMSTKVLR